MFQLFSVPLIVKNVLRKLEDNIMAISSGDVTISEMIWDITEKLWVTAELLLTPTIWLINVKQVSPFIGGSTNTNQLGS